MSEYITISKDEYKRLRKECDVLRQLLAESGCEMRFKDTIIKERDAATQRAEKAETEAAAMREAVVSTCCMPDDTVCILGSKADREILQRVIDGTAGRDLLDELNRLREANRTLMDGIANIASDFYSSGNNEAELALSQMREALQALASEVSK